MLVKDNEALRQAAETAYVLSADEQIRLQCQAREDYYRDQRYMQGRLEKAEKGLEKAEKELEEKELQIQELLREMEQLKMRQKDAG